VAKKLQECALTEGAFLRHMHSALFPVSGDLKFLAISQLSRRLVALWVADNAHAERLLRRILVTFLSSGRLHVMHT